MYVPGVEVNKQTKNFLEASKAMSNGKWAARNDNAPKNGSDGNSLNLPRISSARSDAKTTGTRAHHAVQFLSPRSQVLFVHNCWL